MRECLFGSCGWGELKRAGHSCSTHLQDSPEPPSDRVVGPCECGGARPEREGTNGDTDEDYGGPRGLHRRGT